MAEFTNQDPDAISLLEKYGLDIKSNEKVTVITPEDPYPKVPEGNVDVRGSKDNDEITASGDYLYSLTGYNGNDVLIGSNKEDFIQGLKGKGTLTGGEGRDYFTFYTRDIVKNKIDTITDLDKNDVIYMESKIVDDKLLPGFLTRDDIVAVNKNSKKIDEVLIFVKSEGALYYNDSNGVGDTALINIDGVVPRYTNFELF